LDRSDKAEDLLEEERFGYQSVHYLVRLSAARAQLAEYERFAGAVTEVQVRTILQHAWAEIEHDIQYKSSAAIPRDIRRRFMALAGMLELADREFQAIQDQDAALNTAARRLIEQGKYSEVEITPTALKLYLDQQLGADGRMSEFSYDWTVRLLKRLGFRSLDQINQCISTYDDDKVSRLLAGARQGQVTRFEYLLLAGLGEKFIERHTFAGQPWFDATPKSQLKKLREAGVPVAIYDPLPAQQNSAVVGKEG
ncbi:MAG: GTP pyrophosphokinase family protein, partial [Gammaproteobacteria bacterium]